MGVLVINSEALMSGKEYKIGDYTLKDNGLYLPMTVDGKVQNVKMSEVIFIEKTIENIDTDEAYIKLTYKYKGKYKTIKVTMGMLSLGQISCQNY